MVLTMFPCFAAVPRCSFHLATSLVNFAPVRLDFIRYSTLKPILNIAINRCHDPATVKLPAATQFDLAERAAFKHRPFGRSMTGEKPCAPARRTAQARFVALFTAIAPARTVRAADTHMGERPQVKCF